MTKATDIPAMGTLVSTPAANADQHGLWQAQDEANDIGNDATPAAWDAFDVWRRLIKEPRDRRRPHPG